MQQQPETSETDMNQPQDMTPQQLQYALNGALQDPNSAPAIHALAQSWLSRQPEPEYIPHGVAVENDKIADTFVGGVLPEVGDHLVLVVYDVADLPGQRSPATVVKCRHMAVTPEGLPRHTLLADAGPAVAKTDPAQVPDTKPKKPRAARR